MLRFARIPSFRLDSAFRALAVSGVLYFLAVAASAIVSLTR